MRTSALKYKSDIRYLSYTTVNLLTGGIDGMFVKLIIDAYVRSSPDHEFILV